MSLDSTQLLNVCFRSQADSLGEISFTNFKTVDSQFHYVIIENMNRHLSQSKIALSSHQSN